MFCLRDNSHVINFSIGFYSRKQTKIKLKKKNKKMMYDICLFLPLRSDEGLICVI